MAKPFRMRVAEGLGADPLSMTPCRVKAHLSGGMTEGRPVNSKQPWILFSATGSPFDHLHYPKPKLLIPRSSYCLVVSELRVLDAPHFCKSYYITNTSAKQEKHNGYPTVSLPCQGLKVPPIRILPPQSVCLLILASMPKVCWTGNSPLSPSWALAASARGFRLMTRSSFSPASEIRGTARQQSKSLVRIRFTCQDRFGVRNREGKQEHQILLRKTHESC